MKMIDAALRYQKRGFAVIPASGKRPLIDWRKHQWVKPTMEEVRSWWEQYPNANIALVTGEISGIVVVDVDGATSERFTPTAVVESSPSHFHYYYKHPGGVVPCSASVVGPSIDIRGDGGVVIAPPSVHVDRSGKPDGRYAWIVGPKMAEFAPLPDWIMERAKIRKPLASAVLGSEKGSRNVTTTSVVGSLLARYPPEQWESVCWTLILAYNATRNRPPLSEQELRTIFVSIAGRQQKAA